VAPWCLGPVLRLLLWACGVQRTSKHSAL